MLLLFVLFGFRRWRRRRRGTHNSFTLSRKRISRRNRIFSLDLIRICRRDGPVAGVEGRTKRRHSGHGHRRVTSEVWSRRRRTRADSGTPANVVSRWQASVNGSLLCFFPVIIFKWFNIRKIAYFTSLMILENETLIYSKNRFLWKWPVLTFGKVLFLMLVFCIKTKRIAN